MVRRLRGLVPMLRKSPLEYSTIRKNVSRRGAPWVVERDSRCLSLVVGGLNLGISHVFKTPKWINACSVDDARPGCTVARSFFCSLNPQRKRRSAKASHQLLSIMTLAGSGAGSRLGAV